MSHAPQLVTGRRYFEGEPRPVTGWLVQCPNLNGKSADTLVPVTLLTPEGIKLSGVLVHVIDILHMAPRNFARFTDHMLWRVAETDMSGLSEHALAELAYRERLALMEKAHEESARLALSRRSADELMSRV